MPDTTRQAIAAAAAAAVSASAARLSATPIVVGCDGFIDAIIHIVDQRRSMADDDCTYIDTIEAFGRRVSAAAGKSTNMEMVVREERFGGNGPLLAGGLAQFGAPVRYIGCVGSDDDARRPHVVFAPFVERLTKAGGSVTPLAPPARTDALEFSDGKLMMGKPANLDSVTWDRLKEDFGLPALKQAFGNAELIGLVNWVMMRGAQGIWQGLVDDVLSAIPAGSPRPRVFIDLCDPAKRTDADVASAMALLGVMARHVPVTLGLNLSEAQRIDQVVGTKAIGEKPTDDQLRQACVAIRAKLGIDCVVIHPRHGAAGAFADGQSAWFTGPLVRHPKLSTGAGDHFNAGFCLGQLLGLPVEQALAVGTATSGAYVRDAMSPTLDRLAAMLRDMPAPE